LTAQGIPEQERIEMAYGLLLLRVFVGGAFVGHGTQKLFGWFGGYGPQGTGGFFSSVGFKNGVLMAVLAGLCEAGGGALLLLGLATPFACLLLAVTMINAIGAVTFKRQFLLGSELELTYLVIAIALAATGPGRLSLDRAIGWDDNISGLWWGLPVAFAAALISLVTLTLFREKPAPEAAAAV
jgi:putative oxidoreductase